MTEAQAVEAISAAFVTAWTAAQPTVPFALDNETMPSGDLFASLSIRHSTSTQMTTGPRGTRRVKRSGTIYVRLWGPADAGRAGLSTLCDVVRSILEATDIAGAIHTLLSATREIGPDEGNGTGTRWWSVGVSVGFWYEATI